MSVELTTPNNSFRYPTSGNNGTDFASGLQDFADDVDGMWRSGTFVSRPTASAVKAQSVYKATDTGVWYVSDGTNWNTMLIAGAWQTLTLASPVQAWGSGYTPSARLVGDEVELCGQLINNGSPLANATTLFTVPSALKPAHAVTLSTMQNFTATTATKPYPLTISTSTGNVSTASTADGTYASSALISLDGFSYRLS